MSINHVEITSASERPFLKETGVGIGRVEGFYGNTDQALLDELLPIRENFVIDRMHWREFGHKEGDPYDLTPDTLQLALRVGQNGEAKILSSLRLTKVPSFNAALSLSMVKQQNAMHDEALTAAEAYGLDATAARGNLYDLTRLVSNIDQTDDIGKVLGSFMELFGAAAGTLRNNTPAKFDQEDIKWMFVVTDTIKSVLEAQGVEMTRLTDGYVSEKDEQRSWKSHFYYVSQESAIRAVTANQATLPNSYPHLVNGLAKTGWNL